MKEVIERRRKWKHHLKPTTITLNKIVNKEITKDNLVSYNVTVLSTR